MKKQFSYICISCGTEFPKWFGQCPNCNEWNVIVETDKKTTGYGSRDVVVVPLSEVEFDEVDRIKTCISEFDLVCGGGMVPGSIILIGGEPGIGKSTLALQISHSLHTLYVAGEESPVQIRSRATRLGLNIDSIYISSNTQVEEIIKLILSNKPECVIVDSIQTLFTSEIQGLIGSVGQIRESTAQLVAAAKKTGIPIIITGHITKDGAIAGPKILEHQVDTVLYFEGDFSKDFRILRAFKNRFGSVNEIGIFRMTGKGLIEVKDKNSIFLDSYYSSPGSAISAALEGTRTILFEVQSLVSFSSFPNPRRMADGLDLNRLILMIAVLEKHGSLKLNSFDVFINVAGGFQINETSSDLAIAMSIASSLKEIPIAQDIGFLGEISLSGEIRPVSQCLRRINEFNRSGFKEIIISKNDSKEALHRFEGEVIGVKNISEALDYLF